MSSRRLVNRGERHSLLQQTASPRNAPRQSSAAPEPTPLPTYELPQCPLTADAKRQLEQLFSGRETKKYEDHLKLAIATVTSAAVEGNDRVVTRREGLKRSEKKRQKLEEEGGKEGEDYKKALKKEEEERMFTNVLEKKVDKLNSQAERAVRELIDCKEELGAQRDILGEVSENVATAPVGRQRRRGGNEDGEEGEMAPAEDVEILSALELTQEKKEEYKRKWEARSLHQRYIHALKSDMFIADPTRYAENGDYVTHKRVVHDSMFPQDGAPPLAKTTTWFKDGLPEAPAAARRRVQASQAGGAEEDSDSDDEPIITAQTQDFRDPISMAIIVNPVTSTICKHTYEKANIMEHIRNDGQPYAGDGRGRIRTGPKRIKCPTVGCDAVSIFPGFEVFVWLMMV